MADQVDMRCLMLGVMLDRYVQEIENHTSPEYIAAMVQIMREQLGMQDEERMRRGADQQARASAEVLVRDARDTIDTAVRLGCLPGADVLSDVNAYLIAISNDVRRDDIDRAHFMAQQTIEKLNSVAYEQTMESQDIDLERQ